MSKTWLPPLLNEIADVAGLDAAIAISDARGGSRVTIPAKVKDDHWLVRACGKEAAEKLCDHFRSGNQGATIDLPVGPTSSANALRRKVDQMIRDGVSANQIAQRAGVHRTTVFRRKASILPADRVARSDENQLSLFDDPEVTSG